MCIVHIALARKMSNHQTIAMLNAGAVNRRYSSKNGLVDFKMMHSGYNIHIKQYLEKKNNFCVQKLIKEPFKKASMQINENRLNKRSKWEQKQKRNFV